MRAELVSVGTELLLGQIVDTNSAYLSGRLAQLGIDCLHMSTVGDNLGRATEAFERALSRSELILSTGGLGPTEDDLTREAIAGALGEAPEVDPDLERELRAWFSGRGLAMPERNRKQAWLIPSARPLGNPLGTAPGWDVARAGRRIVAMPGVPREMTRMWEAEVEPTLGGGAVLRSRTLKLLGIGESGVEEALDELVRSTAPTVATYAKTDGVHVRITDKDADLHAVAERIAAMEAAVRARLHEHIWGVDDESLSGVVGRSLRARGWRLVTAESMTRGDVAVALADATPDWYAGGVVLPRADRRALLAASEAFGAEVVLVLPHGDTESALVLRTPADEAELVVRFASPAEGRRRAALSALDLVRKVLGRGAP
ncbi:MAG: molybdopterin-binding protein [Chloroflexota bacterium]|nr:molybdopterin-binding protein [Chloroflexota bacterium]